ncbi:hypothetical protein BJ742DRAFT_786458 [Cladochytrium replicatum]|nr:hypothetical protein BJ742DRAFT_786458 [Cladochytrium replicatum]
MFGIAVATQTDFVSEKGIQTSSNWADTPPESPSDAFVLDVHKAQDVYIIEEYEEEIVMYIPAASPKAAIAEAAEPIKSDNAHYSNRAARDAKPPRSRLSRPAIIADIEKAAADKPRHIRKADGSSSTADNLHLDSSPTERENRDEKVEGSQGSSRVASGGADKKNQRLTEEELAERITEIRRKNAAILKKQEEVDADRQAWEAQEAVLRQKDEEQRQIIRRHHEERNRAQETLRREREENAARKAITVDNREWDHGKDPQMKRVSNEGGYGRPSSPGVDRRSSWGRGGRGKRQSGGNGGAWVGSSGSARK